MFFNKEKPPPEETLESITSKFIEDTGFRPTTAAEIEFNLFSENDELPTKIIALLTIECKNSGINIYGIHNEIGKSQYEISLETTDSPLKTAQNIDDIKKIIVSIINSTNSTNKSNSVRVDFSAKPFEKQPGNGLHIHISLKDKNGNNPYMKNKEDNPLEEESDLIKYSIGGLLKAMPESMIYFAPTEESYQRYTAKFNEYDNNNPLSKFNNAPVNISWGANNRSTAIRIPSSTASPKDRHIEHRVPYADSNPYIVLSAILVAIHYGIMNKIEPIEKLYGNAFDEQYDLSPLPTSLKEAKKLNKNGKILRKYF